MSERTEWQQELEAANNGAVTYKSKKLGGVWVSAYPHWNGVGGRQYWVVGMTPIEKEWLDGLFWRAIVDDFGQLVPIERF